jgi:hypothetical protein
VRLEAVGFLMSEEKVTHMKHIGLVKAFLRLILLGVATSYWNKYSVLQSTPKTRI